MKTVKVISYKAYNNSKAGWVDKVIAILSFGRFSHTEIVFDNNQSFSMETRNEQKGRFTTMNISKEQWNIQEIEVTTEEYLLMYNKALKLLGKSYDLLGALQSPLRVCLIKKPNKYFCSEVVVEVLKEVPRFKKLFDKACKYSPNRLEKVVDRFLKKNI